MLKAGAVLDGPVNNSPTYEPIARAITLDELPRWSPWPHRLLGLSDAHQHQRTKAEILREYDAEKYGPLLAAAQRDDLSAEDLWLLQLGDPQRMVAMSEGSHLSVASVGLAAERSVGLHVEHIVRVAAETEAATIVDLGCGYGHLLSRLGAHLEGVRLLGGELSPTAVALARHIHRHDPRIEVQAVDLLSDGPCAPLEDATGPVVVVTAFVIQQLSSAAPVVELLHRYRDRIAAMVTLEPDEDLLGEGLLGLLRLRYQHLNDYSGDLLKVLGQRTDVHVDTVIADAIGSNALLPGTLAVWRFKP